MLSLRPYQVQAINDLRDAYRAGSRAPLLCLPTGGGKTIIFTAIAQSAVARGRQVLILVHRRELLHQASRKLTAIGLDHGLIAAGIPATSNPVQVASVQTLVRRLPGMDWQPSLVIIDEAHHASAGSWARILQQWPDAYRLGVTATPCRLDGRGLSTAFDSLVQGPTVADLTAAGYLSPARIYAPPVIADLSGLRRRAGDYAVDQAANAMDRPTVTGDAIGHYQRLAGAQRAIAFCCSIAHAESVARSFNAAGISAATLLGNTPDRDAVVAAFDAGTVQILVTVDVVSEGFDIPAASCAVLLRPTQSLGLFLQQVGRVLRPAPGKQQALILDHVGNVHRHGFPDDLREWSLADGVRRAAGKAAPTVRTCPSCYAAFKPAPICPLCGADCAQNTKRGIVQVDGELIELAKSWTPRAGEKVYCSYWQRDFFYVRPSETLNKQSREVMVCSDRITAKYLARLSGEELSSAIFATFKKLGDDALTHTWMPYLQQLETELDKSGRQARQEQGRARTLPELLALAKERGYSPGWAYKVHASRGKR